jgi:hypothetical protein
MRRASSGLSPERRAAVRVAGVVSPGAVACSGAAASAAAKSRVLVVMVGFT